MTDDALLMLLADYHYVRWLATAALIDAKKAFAEGDELLGYDNLFAWVEYLEDSNFLFGMLLGKEMKAMNILRGWV